MHDIQFPLRIQGGICHLAWCLAWLPMWHWWRWLGWAAVSYVACIVNNSSGPEMCGPSYHSSVYLKGVGPLDQIWDVWRASRKKKPACSIPDYLIWAPKPTKQFFDNIHLSVAIGGLFWFCIFGFLASKGACQCVSIACQWDILISKKRSLDIKERVT